MKLYDHQGLRVTRTVGFNSQFNFEPEPDQSENDGAQLQLVGSSVTYWSKTEERWITDKRKK